MPEKQTNIRLDPEVKSQAIAAAADRGLSLSKLVEAALTAYLGGDTTSPQPAPDNTNLHQQIADLRDRVEALEHQKIPRGTTTPPPAPAAPAPAVAAAAPMQPAQDAQQGASTAPQVSGHPPGDHPEANGGRWLTTSQALDVARARGWEGADGKGLKRWGEQGKLGDLGLRYCPHGSKLNTLASFEDLRWEGGVD